MKLYYTKGACSLAVRILINELNIPCEYEAVDLKTKKTESGQDFLSINPKGSVPTLALDDEKILTENAVIHQYIAEHHKAYQILPPESDFMRYRVLEWLNFVTTELHKGFSPLFNPKISLQTKDEVIKPIIISKLKFVNTQLEKHDYLVGDHYTLPDGYLFVMLTWAHSFNLDASEFHNLKKFFTLLKSRPSVIKSLQEENLNID